MNYGIGCRGSLDPTLLWLCCRLAVAALIQPLAWELPYAAPVALKKKKAKKGYTKSKYLCTLAQDTKEVSIIVNLKVGKQDLNEGCRPKGAGEPAPPPFDMLVLKETWRLQN